MPFSGIPAGSQLEKKIDRCMESIMKRQGIDKSRAIAICRATIPGASKKKETSFSPPQSVRNNAKRGLELRQKYGRGGLSTEQAGKQGIGSGVARARDLANGRSLSLDTIKRMANFFNRHEKNKNTPPDKGNGMIAWLLWGGDAGRQWANGILNRSTTKSRQTAITEANYRDAGPASTKTCQTCKFDNNGRCAVFKFQCGQNNVCDEWLPNIPALRERGRQLTEQVAKEGRGFSARRGQQIRGGLFRGDDGKFSSQGGGATQATVNPRDKFAAIALANGKQLNPQAVSRLLDAGLVDKDGKLTDKGRQVAGRPPLPKVAGAKPKKGGGKRGGGKGKPDPVTDFMAGLTDPEKELLTDILIKGVKPSAKAKAVLTKLLKAGYIDSTGKLTTNGRKLVKLLQKRTEKKEAGGSPSPIMAHGPGGLFSTLGLQGPGQKKRKKKRTKKSFTVFKDANGQSRWVSLSSNAFRDRDEEIVSTKALQKAVKKADANYRKYIASGDKPETANLKARGPLRWWHVPGLDLGVCDYQAVHGRMLIESGTFTNERIAEKMAKATDLNVSIGFRHPATEPNRHGVYENISIFERSPTPAGRAANKFTSLSIKKGAKPEMNQEKIKALRLLLGDDANAILEQAETTQKGAEASGVAYKSDNSEFYRALENGEMREIYNAYKAAEEDLDDSDAELWDDEDYKEDATEGEALKMSDGMTELKASMSRVEQKMSDILAMLGGKRDEEKKKEAATEARIAELEKELATLKGEQPTATRGYRASLDAAPIQDDAPKGEHDWNEQRQKAIANMGHSGQMYTAAEALAAGLFKQ